MSGLIGRIEEQKILENKLFSTRPELIAVYGRRRIGKTYLIRTFLKDHIVFEMTGIHGATLSEQLGNFSLALGEAIKSKTPIPTPINWQQAFHELNTYLLDHLDPQQAVVFFFDEFPWIHTRRSNFLRAFDHWWNSSGTKHANLKVVICGSAASWMIDKIINDRGGLHNRVTQKIRLLPFTLSETAAYLQSKNILLDQYQILQLYMAMGGIPYYLQHIAKGESSAQVIDRLFFTKNGTLQGEFKNLYQSLFNNADQHETIIRALAKKSKGLTRDEIIKASKLTSGGTTTKMLKELEESGFIVQYIPFGKTVNESIYKLADEYSLFYLKFVENTKSTGKGTWLRQFNTPSYKSWSGFSFESVCQKHVAQIKKALGIEGVLTEESAWRCQPSKGGKEQGAQIDLLIDRQDRCINICEMKYASEEFIIDKKYATELDRKVNTFQQATKTKKTLFLTMVTTYGVKKNEYHTGRIVSDIVMKDLFR